ncbi:MAG: phosphoethanolamine transferase [Gammaproteobacteria bacterium]
MTLLVSIALVLVYNGQFWTTLLAELPGHSGRALLFTASFGVLLVVVFNLFLQLLPARAVLKPVLMLTVISAALVSHFASSYGAIIDRHMIASLLQTDFREARDLLGFGLVARTCLLGVLPAVLIWFTPLKRQSWRRAALVRGGTIVSSGVVLALILSSLYQDYAFMLREHRELGQMVNPGAAILSAALYALDEPLAAVPIKTVAGDVRRTVPANAGRKPMVIVLILGETARADNFSLNGYPRTTNPELAALPVISFSNVHSCGTSTAESVPCMFSHLGQSDFSVKAARTSENLLDILKRAGLDILWIENNSGCKGVCDRVATDKTSHAADDALCPDGECQDEIMLEPLRQALSRADDDLVVVMHQNGSHGPAYFRRYPPRFRAFLPACETSNIQSCSTDEIRSAYDNTILYTDHVLAQVIATLEARSEDIDAAMVYVSDHGESLGEANTWLHGLPYRIAPDVQKHVPMIMWSSGSYRTRQHLDQNCLWAARKDAITHDHLFHSVLGMLNVQTDVYEPRLDIFAQCRPTIPPALMAASGG